MISRKAAFLAAILVFTAIVAVISDSWVVGLAALPLAFALLAGAWGATRGPLDVRAKFALPEGRILEGDAIPVDLEVGVAGSRTGLVEIVAELSPVLDVAGGAPSTLAQIGRRAPVAMPLDLAFTARGRRSTLGRVHVRERGAFGMLSREASAPLDVDHVVMPRPEVIPDLQILARGRIVRPEGIAVGRPGGTQEFYGLRRYLPGDSIGFVNWKQTAKRSYPIVNEYEVETPADFMVVLDARELSNVGGGRHSTMESGLRASLGLADRALKRRAKVGLIVLADLIRWVPAASGRRQSDHLVELALDVKAGGTYAVDQALSLLPNNVLPRGAFVALVTPHLDDPSIESALYALANERRARVLVVSPVPESAEIASYDLGPTARATARALRLARRAAIDRLRLTGATVVDWDVRTSLASALAREEA